MARKHGTENASTKEVKAAVQEAFELLGGVPALAAWAAQNPYYFYVHVWGKLIPKPAEINMQVSEGAKTILNAVSVADPQSALTMLERLEDARNAHGGGGRERDQREVDPEISAYKVHMQEANGNRDGTDEEDYTPNAAPARQD